ncbi:MAG: CCA tRNA nucleotidyltransferase [Rhodobacteraceae bacterium]|nr:CCA tRNA nucleotidyltransferase [Paracoccaceae bacterium]
MRVAGDWLTSSDTQAVLGMLTDAGHLAYAVGGCARNALLDVPVADVDIATSALPEEVVRLAQEAGLKAIPTGLEHGTITVVSDGEPFEVTTFRKDVDTDGRRAVVSFSDNISDDAVRRDFTVNALYVEADGTLHDPLGGLPDIKAGRIRFIEDAAPRIEEDYLRILRFFRFTAWYGDPSAGLDAEGLAACATHVDGISKLSKERLGAEMKKLLAAPDPAPALAAMFASGVLAQILPGADPQYVAPLVHLEQAADIPPRWQRRMVAMGGDDHAKRLRLSKAEAKQLYGVNAAMQSGEPAKVMAYHFGADAALDAKMIEAATLSSPLPDALSEHIAEGVNEKFPIKAVDLLDRIGVGPQLGAELKRLENLWVNAGFKLSKKELLQS